MIRPGFPAVFGPCLEGHPEEGPHGPKCRLYRYVLWREWDPSLPYLAVIGLNPSTADDKHEPTCFCSACTDNTIKKCVRLAKRWGFGALCMLNLFAWRDTEPEDMKAAEDPVGPDNDAWLAACSLAAGRVLAAWGNHGLHRGRSGAVRSMLQGQLWALKVNSTLEPQHPLYVKEDTQPFVLPSM